MLCVCVMEECVCYKCSEYGIDVRYDDESDVDIIEDVWYFARRRRFFFDDKRFVRIFV